MHAARQAAKQSDAGLSSGKKKLLVMGRSGAGKTSMRSLIFANFTASDTRRLGATIDVEHSTVQFMGNLSLNIWDCGGQHKYLDNYINEQKENIFGNVEVLIFVFDLETTDKDSEYTLYDECLQNLSLLSPDAKVYCLVHKIDRITDADQKTSVVEAYRKAILKRSGAFRPQVHGTSIWDHTLFQAWSNIVFTLVPNMVTIKSNLARFCDLTDAAEVVLFERATFLVVCCVLHGGQDPNLDRYMTISQSIKQYRNACTEQATPFRSTHIRTRAYSLFIEPFTKSTYILVITADPDVEPAVTKANIEAARSHFAKLAD